MKLISLLVLSLAMSCGSTSNKEEPIISNDPIVTSEEEKIVVESSEIEPALPLGAVSGNFDGLGNPFYAHTLPSEGNKTIVSFENNSVPSITLLESNGGKLYNLHFEEFDRDLLLVAANTKDPIFIKYHLYINKNQAWKPVVEPFTLHISHTLNDFIPIEVDPANPKLMFRHYSVFDLDQESELGYTWRLLTESVPILNN